MNRITIIGILLSLFLLSCSEDKDNDIKDVDVFAEFNMTLSGESPNAIITIDNKSSESDKYHWAFSDGAERETFLHRQPPQIKVDNPGKFTVTLTVEKDGIRKATQRTVNISGDMGIEIFNDVEFGLKRDDTKYGRLFSLTDGESHKELDKGNFQEENIHLALFSTENNNHFFTSPTEKTFGLTKATTTKVCNEHSMQTLTKERFKNINNDSFLKDLNFNEDKKIFSHDSFPRICMFETSTGRKGLIYIKDINDSRILANIKVQKY